MHSPIEKPREKSHEPLDGKFLMNEQIDAKRNIAKSAT